MKRAVSILAPGLVLIAASIAYAASLNHQSTGSSGSKPKDQAKAPQEKKWPVLPISVKHKDDPESSVTFDWKQDGELIPMKQPEIINQGQPYFEKFEGDQAKFVFEPRFANNTPYMYDKVTMVLAMVQKGTNKILYESKPFDIINFKSNRWPMDHILGPACTAYGTQVPISVPSNTWRVDTNPQVIMIGYHRIGFTDKIEYPWELYHAILCMPDDAIKQMKANPKLLEMRGDHGLTPMLMAISSGQVKEAEYLAENGGKWDDMTDQGLGAVFLAAMSNEPKMLDLVYQHVKDINVVTKDQNMTPIDAAALLWLPASAAWLVDHHADLTIKDFKDYTPLQRAAVNRDAPMMKILIDGGADIHVRYVDGSDLYALSVGYNDPLDLLYAKGLDCNTENPQTGMTPCETATSMGLFQSVPWFMKHGVDINKKNSKGMNCYDYAKQSNTLHTDQFFRDYLDKIKKQEEGTKGGGGGGR